MIRINHDFSEQICVLKIENRKSKIENRKSKIENRKSFQEIPINDQQLRSSHSIRSMRTHLIRDDVGLSF